MSSPDDNPQKKEALERALSSGNIDDSRRYLDIASQSALQGPTPEDSARVIANEHHGTVPPKPPVTLRDRLFTRRNVIVSSGVGALAVIGTVLLWPSTSSEQTQDVSPVSTSAPATYSAQPPATTITLAPEKTTSSVAVPPATPSLSNIPTGTTVSIRENDSPNIITNKKSDYTCPQLMAKIGMNCDPVMQNIFNESGKRLEDIANISARLSYVNIWAAYPSRPYYETDSGEIQQGTGSPAERAASVVAACSSLATATSFYESIGAAPFNDSMLAGDAQKYGCPWLEP